MISFKNMQYKCSTFGPNSALPSLKYSKENYKAKTTINDFEGLFIGYGQRDTSYPYTQQNLYCDEKLQDVKVAILENEYMYAEFLMDFGGRLWKLIDKKSNKNVLYTNDVIRFRNLSIRNAWFSGGVEWNCGIIGHSPFTCSTMNCAKVTGKNGEEVIRFYEFERVREIYYQMDFWLEENKLFAKVRIQNTKESVVPMYWWSTIASPEFKDGRVIVPANSAYNNSDGMGIKKSSIPIDNGIDVSYPQNIPDTIDYFYDIDENENKFIANVDKDGFGLLQFSSNRLKGRKLFSWGHRKGSDHWQRMLTDKAGYYVEVQAGLGKTQYECIPMPPKTVWSFIECYTLAQLDNINVDYNLLIDKVNDKINSICSSNELDKKCSETDENISLVKGELINVGSGFGYVNNILTNDAPNHLEFKPNDDAQMWIDFINNGILGDKNISFANGNALKKILINNDNGTSWNVSYQLALMSFDSGDYEKSKLLCEKSLILDNNYLNNHLYAVILYQLNKDNFSYFALKSLKLKADNYSVCETIISFLLQSQKYEDVVDAFEYIDKNIADYPRLQMYLSVAYFNLNNYNKAEEILMKDGGLNILDYREGDRMLDNLYKGLMIKKYSKSEVEVPEIFDFVVSK